MPWLRFSLWSTRATSRLLPLLLAGLCLPLVAHGQTQASQSESGYDWAMDANFIPRLPNVPVRSYVLLDTYTNRVIASRNAHEKVAPASITKVMTAYVVGNAIRNGELQLSDIVTVSKPVSGSRMFLRSGDKVTVEQLLYGIAVLSGNDASLALAEKVAGTEEAFAEYMNLHARRLGLENTQWSDAMGLADVSTHHSTAHDLALLTSAFIVEFPDIYAMFSKRDYTYRDIRQFNRNTLLRTDDSIDGVKTGYTEDAGYCLVASAVRGDRRLIAVVLGAGLLSEEDLSSQAVGLLGEDQKIDRRQGEEDRNQAASQLLEYGFRFFETLHIGSALAERTRIPVRGASTGFDEPALAVGLDADTGLVIPRDAVDDLRITAILEPVVYAPVAEKQVVGKLYAHLGGRVLATAPLVALHEVESGGIFSMLIARIRVSIGEAFGMHQPEQPPGGDGLEIPASSNL